MAAITVDQRVDELISSIISCVENHIENIKMLRYEVSWKEDGSPLTKADTYVESLLTELIHRWDSSVTVIGEESYYNEAIDNFDGLIAVLDPIDGTENFCSGLKEWGLCFTLWENHHHLGSLILMPELKEHIRSGQPIEVVTSRIHGLSSSMCESIRNSLSSEGEFRMMGCCAYNMFNVIRGSFARFSNPKGAQTWDILPGLMLALEHQCEVMVDDKKYTGEFLKPDRKYCIDIQHRYDLHPRQGPLG